MENPGERARDEKTKVPFNAILRRRLKLGSMCGVRTVVLSKPTEPRIESVVGLCACRHDAYNSTGTALSFA